MNTIRAKGIHSDIEKLLTKEVERYFNKKNHQKLKIEVNTSSDGSNTLSQLDRFIAEERKCLKDEYDTLMA
ncbi:hypothetical protein RclHR1_01040028 [Rhizophagus clarus]|uniref:Uncharacterized protein n=1 Tax=Rhizophagus clarus TaxID=94130 RepID=A0A2Z6Q1G9_9GLOM|nr:hypothetical protein RclHR1_01040028 [Rhizophagus clarus]